MESFAEILYKLYQSKLLQVAGIGVDPFRNLSMDDKEAWRLLSVHLIAEGWSP